jgi:trehalose 6-phosphate phosphatase
VTVEGEAARRLSPLLDDPSTAGVFTDFDGTLAPIVENPPDARPLPGVTDALCRLAGTVARVGVISGRPAEFLAAHLGETGVSMWGLYGLEAVERDEDGETHVVPLAEAEEWRPVVEDVGARAERELGDRAGVERKRFTLTIHYRRNPELEPVVRDWAQHAARETGLTLGEAKMSFELSPPVPHGKGVVLEGAADGLHAACFFGDDRGDLTAFDALDRLDAKGLATVRIGVRSDEAPAELLDRADVVLDGPPDVVAALELLAGRKGR